MIGAGRFATKKLDIYHDIFGGNFNLDHVIVSAKGIYVVETKTYSKPIKGEAKIKYDGNNLLIDGRPALSDPVVQVKAGAKWLTEILQSSTGKTFHVRSAIVFPGWYVESSGTPTDVWILNPKGLPKYLEGQKDVINNEDVNLAIFHLRRFIRMA